MISCKKCQARRLAVRVSWWRQRGAKGADTLCTTAGIRARSVERRTCGLGDCEPAPKSSNLFLVRKYKINTRRFSDCEVVDSEARVRLSESEAGGGMRHEPEAKELIGDDVFFLMVATRPPPHLIHLRYVWGTPGHPVEAISVLQTAFLRIRLSPRFGRILPHANLMGKQGNFQPEAHNSTAFDISYRRTHSAVSNPCLSFKHC
ncbi:hypothetical protein B0H13DRAFT_1036392 [Mycena leptocephala]|nr:hypothetical protein B0H13DRAFT_1036392 [Mycena leptocephala]